MYSFSKQSHIFILIPGHLLILSLTDPQTHLTTLLGCQKDASDLTCSNQMHFPLKLDSFSMFLFSSKSSFHLHYSMSPQAAIISEVHHWFLKQVHASCWVCKTVHWNTGRKQLLFTYFLLSK